MVIFNPIDRYVEFNGKRINLNYKENQLMKMLAISDMKLVSNNDLKEYYKHPVVKISRFKKETGLDIKVKYRIGYYLEDIWIECT